MAMIMAFLMCCTIVALQNGVGTGYWSTVLTTYLLVMPLAFLCVLIVRPLVMRLVALTVNMESVGENRHR